MGTVASLEELQGADRGVGRERLVPPPVSLLEQRELGTGVRSFPAHDHPHPDRPLGQQRLRQQSGDLSDVRLLTDLPVRFQRRGPHPLIGDGGDGGADGLGDGEPDRILHAAATFGVFGGEPLQQRVRGTRPIDSHEEFLAVRPRNLGDRLGQDLDVVGRGVRTGITRT